MNKNIIDLQLTAQFQRAQLINTAIAGFVLLLVGIDLSTNPESSHPVRAWVNIVFGAAVLASVIHKIKTLRTQRNSLTQWVDVFAGIALIVQAANIYHPDKIFQPALLYFLLGVTTTAKAFFYSTIPQVRRLEYNENGFKLRTSLFHTVKLQWEDIDSISMETTKLNIVTKDRRQHSTNLRKVENKQQILRIFQQYVQSFTS